MQIRLRSPYVLFTLAMLGQNLFSFTYGQGEGGLVAAIGMFPFVGADYMLGMGRIFQCIVRLVRFSIFDCPDLFVDPDHRVAESVEFGLVFAFRRLDHDRAGNGEAEGRSVKAIVHQSFGHIFCFDACAGLEGAEVDDELMGAGTVDAAVEDLILFFQPRLHIVGVEDGILCGLFHSFGAQHFYIRIADQQDAGGSEGGCGDGMTRLAELSSACPEPAGSRST